MPSLYARYVAERENLSVHETDLGFATWSITGVECYVRELYVLPDYRRTGEGSRLTDHVAAVARERGCTLLTGTVDPRATGADASMLSLLAYGMKPRAVVDGLVWFAKELK